ncbi:MAG: methyltransferase [Gaiella sp.]
MTFLGRDELSQLVLRLVADDLLAGATLSKPVKGDPGRAARVTVDPLDGRYRWRHHHQARTEDEILTPDETARRLEHLLGGAYRQGLLRSPEADFQVLSGGKGTTVLRRPPSRLEIRRSHDRQKRRVLAEGTPIPFLVELGVMTRDGRVRSSRQDKFRQVNRFCELVEDVLPALPPGRLRVLDFGSGRSTLTFALHHLLTVIHGREVELVGLDLKAEVVAECEALARRLGAEGLRFAVGDIATWSGEGAELVVSLHACDTATDAALDRAVRLDASVILAVPCCHHELLRRIDDAPLRPLLRHGILQERFAAEATDAMRAQLLALCGYEVHVVEFVPLEHTAKNVLLRATRTSRPPRVVAQLAGEYRALAERLGAEPALRRMLGDRLEATLR